MHRSGTSLTANWLDKCGLEIGNHYIKTDVGNVTGYYEDKEFVDFHRKLMAKNGFETAIPFETKEIKYDTEDIDEARNLVKKRNNKFSQWAWKDPRTCLFLELWHKVIPNAKVLVLIRHYDEVVDSLIRRKVKAEGQRRNFVSGIYNSLTQNKYRKQNYTNSLLRSWITHNAAILSYLKQKNKKDYILIESKNINEQHENILHNLQNSFGFELKCVPIENVYQKSLLNLGIKEIEFDEGLKSTAAQLYGVMQSYCLDESKNIKKSILSKGNE